MNINRILVVLFLVVVAITVFAVSLATARGDWQGQADDPQAEQLAEQEKAANHQPAANLKLVGATEAVTAPLFIGVDDVTVPAYQVDVNTNDFHTAFSGVEVFGAAYDPVLDKVYFNESNMLYEWGVGGGAPTAMGVISDTGGSALSMVGLAFYKGSLYGVRNVANEAVYKIDLDTLVATVHIDYEDGDYDFGGFAADPNTGTFYGTSDDTSPFGRGLYQINPDGTATLVAPYPDGQTDIDGLAVSEEGLAYLVIDEPGSIYVYDFNVMSYTTPLANPWTTAEVFSAGAWLYNLPESDMEVNPTSVSSSQPAASVMTRTLTISNIGTADLNWNIYEQAPAPAPPAVASTERPARTGDRPVVTSEAECAAYENYAGLEPVGYAEFCMDVSPSPPVVESRDPVDTADATDTAYALDIGPVSDNFVSHPLNDFPGQTIRGANARPIFAMDFDATATTLYGIDNTSRTLGTLDLESGTFITVATVSGIPPGDNISGLAIDPATNEAYLSGIGDAGLDLYSFDLTTGGATPIGSDGSVMLLIDITIGPNGVIYGHDIGTDSIYTIDRNTGAVTLVGPTGVDSNFAQGMDFDNTDGTLYAWTYQGGGTNTYGTIDLATGALTPLATSNPQGEFEGAVQDSGCVAGDISWASVSPTTGTTPPAGSDTVNVVFDSTGLSLDVYTGTLCIASNDLVEPLVTVPMTLTVTNNPAGETNLSYLPVILKQ